MQYSHLYVQSPLVLNKSASFQQIKADQHLQEWHTIVCLSVCVCVINVTLADVAQLWFCQSWLVYSILLSTKGS